MSDITITMSHPKVGERVIVTGIEETCNRCNGTGKWFATVNRKPYKIDCTVCEGSGRTPGYRLVRQVMVPEQVSGQIALTVPLWVDVP